jgi:hypothetical protein
MSNPQKRNDAEIEYNDDDDSPHISHTTGSRCTGGMDCNRPDQDSTTTVGPLVKSQPEDPPASSTHTTTMLTSTSNMENTSDTSARDRAIASWVQLDHPILPNGEEINAKNINFDYNEEDHIGNVHHHSNGNYSRHPVRMTATKSFGARDDAIHHRDHTNDTPYHHDLPAAQAIAIEGIPNIVNAKLVEKPFRVCQCNFLWCGCRRDWCILRIWKLRTQYDGWYIQQ